MAYLYDAAMPKDRVQNHHYYESGYVGYRAAGSDAASLKDTEVGEVAGVIYK